MWPARLLSLAMLVIACLWLYALFAHVISSRSFEEEQWVRLLSIMSIFLTVPTFIVGFGGSIASFGLRYEGSHVVPKDNLLGRFVAKATKDNRDTDFFSTAGAVTLYVLSRVFVAILITGALYALVTSLQAYGALKVATAIGVTVGIFILMIAIIFGSIFGFFMVTRWLNSLLPTRPPKKSDSEPAQ